MPRLTVLGTALVVLAALACGGDDVTPAPTPGTPETETPVASRESTWSSRAPLPTPRSEVASTVLDGKIYVIGGFLANGRTTDTVEVYDPLADRWERRAPLPEARDHAMAAAFGGKVYVFGGGLRQPSRSAYAYDPVTDRWESIADMPFARTSGGAAVIDERIIVVGGVGGSPTATMVYDSGAGAWSQGPPLPEPREHLAVVALDGKVYVLAGRWNQVLSDRNEVLDGLGDSWRSLAPVPTARGGTSAGVVNGRIYVAGGETFSPNRTFPEVEAYDPRSDTWASMPPLPTARHGLAVQGVGDSLYVIGGGPTAGLSVSPANEALLAP